MKASKNIVLAGVALLVGVGGYVGWIAYRASRDLVTLDVRNMEVRDVVRKIEGQTWETILVDKDVQGKVTLRVRKTPLEEVLRIVAGQTFSRPTSLYPLYSTKKSLGSLEKALRGELDAAAHGWTNLNARGMGRGGPLFGGPMMMMGAAQSEARKVSLNIIAKDLGFAALAFDRFAQARVVPEDRASATITLTLKDTPIPAAVGELAKRAKLSWTHLYALQGGFRPGGPGGPGGFARMDDRGPRPDGGTNAGPRRFGPGGDNPERWEEMRRQREALEQELKAVLPADERAKLDQAEAERARLMAEMQSLTPEQRRERMGGMDPARMRQMNIDRILNGSPEQRAEQGRRMREMRQRMEQGAQRGQRPDGQRPQRTQQ